MSELRSVTKSIRMDDLESFIKQMRKRGWGPNASDAGLALSWMESLRASDDTLDSFDVMYTLWIMGENPKEFDRIQEMNPDSGTVRYNKLLEKFKVQGKGSLEEREYLFAHYLGSREDMERLLWDIEFDPEWERMRKEHSFPAKWYEEFGG